MVKSTQRITKLSKFLHFLIIFKILPINVNNQKKTVSFRFLSMTTFAFVMMLILISLINIIPCFLIVDLQKIWKDLMAEMREMKITDILCLVSIFGMFQLYPIFPLVIARGCQWMPTEVLIAIDLKWPKHGFMFLISCASFFLECSLFFVNSKISENFIQLKQTK